jgi:hypothetical protein
MDSGTVFRFLLYVVVAYLAVRWFITMMLVYSRREKSSAETCTSPATPELGGGGSLPPGQNPSGQRS